MAGKNVSAELLRKALVATSPTSALLHPSSSRMPEEKSRFHTCLQRWQATAVISPAYFEETPSSPSPPTLIQELLGAARSQRCTARSRMTSIATALPPADQSRWPQGAHACDRRKPRRSAHAVKRRPCSTLRVDLNRALVDSKTHSAVTRSRSPRERQSRAYSSWVPRCGPGQRRWGSQVQLLRPARHPRGPRKPVPKRTSSRRAPRSRALATSRRSP